MMLETTDNARFSLASYITEDSIDSNGLTTPLDASPPPPQSNHTFSIINIVNDDPLPNIKSYPHITSTNRRRAQTSPRPVPNSIIIQSIPQQQPTIITNNNSKFKRFFKRFNSTNENIIQKNTSEKTISKRWFNKNKSKISPQR